MPPFLNGFLQRPEAPAVALAVVAALGLGSLALGPGSTGSETVAPPPITTTPTTPTTTTPIPDPDPTTEWGSVAEVVERFSDLDDRVVLQVIGDSTGDWSNEWPGELARYISAEFQRPVRLNIWRTEHGGYYFAPLYGGHLPGEPVEIWNGSQPGGDARFAIDNLHALVPEPPDLVIVSLGHNDWADPLSEATRDYEQLHELLAEFGATPPAVLDTVQNSRTAHVQGFEAVKTMIRVHAAGQGIDVIDVDAAFRAVPGWETGLLLPDGVHPNGAGQLVWFDTVMTALGLPG